MPEAIKEQESMKKHGDKLDNVPGTGGEEGGAANLSEEQNDAIPAPDNGGHARSAAAHLGGTVHDHTKPQGNLRQGSAPGARREPPMVVQRVGKQHR